MKKFLIILAVIVGILLCVFHNEINSLPYIIGNQEERYQKFEEKIVTGSPKEVEREVEKSLKLKFLGQSIAIPEGIIAIVGKNPNPEVLRVVLDNKIVKEKLKDEISQNSFKESMLLLDVVYTENAPEKVKIVLEHGYDPYKVNSKNRSAMDMIQETYYKIDPKVFDVIREFYGY